MGACVKVENIATRSREYLKYLEINMTMGQHVRTVVKIAEKNVISNISRILPNIGGPREGIRIILFTVAQSIIILYGAISGEER